MNKLSYRCHLFNWSLFNIYSFQDVLIPQYVQSLGALHEGSLLHDGLCYDALHVHFLLMMSTPTIMSTPPMVCITRVISFTIILDISNVATVATDMVVNTLQPSIRKLDMIIPVNIPCAVILLLPTKVQIFLIIIHLVFIVVWAVLIVIMTTMATTKISTRD